MTNVRGIVVGILLILIGILGFLSLWFNGFPEIKYGVESNWLLSVIPIVVALAICAIGVVAIIKGVTSLK